MTSKLTREWLQHQISAIEAVGITDSNTLAAFKLALAAMDSEPVAYMWDSKRNDIDAPGFYFPEHLFFAESNVKQWGGEVIPLYRHAQQPVVPDEVMPGGLVYSSALPKFESDDRDKVIGYSCFISGDTRIVESQEQAYSDAKAVVNACRAAMLNGGNDE